MGRALIVGDLLLKSNIMLPNRNRGPTGFTAIERLILIVLVMIQFTQIATFIMIMPLGDRLRRELSLTPSQFGSVVACYAWAAGSSSLAAGFFIDRLDRKHLLLVVYGGFALSTLACGLASGFGMLLVARTLAGAFGGLAASVVMICVGDLFSKDKRGRATGLVISAFAIASILGLPIGLMLADFYGRGAPFFAFGTLSIVVWLVAFFILPSIQDHLAHPRHHPIGEFMDVVRVKRHLMGFLFSFFLITGTFMVASFLGPILVTMNHWSERQLAMVYFVAGISTLIVTNMVGRWADRTSQLLLFRLLASGAVVMALVVSNFPLTSLWLATVATSGFMVFAAARMVPAQAMLLTAVSPNIRGAFMSVNTSVQQFATGVAPMIASGLLVENADGGLDGFSLVGLLSACSGGISILLAGFLKSTDGH